MQKQDENKELLQKQEESLAYMMEHLAHSKRAIVKYHSSEEINYFFVEKQDEEIYAYEAWNKTAGKIDEGILQAENMEHAVKDILNQQDYKPEQVISGYAFSSEKSYQKAKEDIKDSVTKRTTKSKKLL